MNMLTKTLLSTAAFCMLVVPYAQSADSSLPLPPLPTITASGTDAPPAAASRSGTTSELKLPDSSNMPALQPVPTSSVDPASPITMPAKPPGSSTLPGVGLGTPSVTAVPPAMPADTKTPAVSSATAAPDVPSISSSSLPALPGAPLASAPAETPSPVAAQTPPAPVANPESAPLPTPNGPLLLPKADASATPLPVTPAAPGASPAPDNTATASPGLPDIKPLPAPPGAPPLPVVPLLPGMTPPTDAAAPPVETVPPVAVSETKPKKVHHHHTVASVSETGSQKHASSGTGNYFRSERLPDTIYKKKYDKNNAHLPVAQYEKQYDGLVFLTAQRDDLNGIRAVLDSGRDMELVDADGDTPLLVAVKHNSINVVRLLLSRHANFNATDHTGMNALQIAQQNGNYLIVHAIEAAGASIAQD